MVEKRIELGLCYALSALSWTREERASTRFGANKTRDTFTKFLIEFEIRWTCWWFILYCFSFAVASPSVLVKCNIITLGKTLSALQWVVELSRFASVVTLLRLHTLA